MIGKMEANGRRLHSRHRGLKWRATWGGRRGIYIISNFEINLARFSFLGQADESREEEGWQLNLDANETQLSNWKKRTIAK